MVELTCWEFKTRIPCLIYPNTLAAFETEQGSIQKNNQTES